MSLNGFLESLIIKYEDKCSSVHQFRGDTKRDFCQDHRLFDFLFTFRTNERNLQIQSEAIAVDVCFSTQALYRFLFSQLLRNLLSAHTN